LNESNEIKMKIVENIGNEYKHEHNDTIKRITKVEDPSYHHLKQTGKLRSSLEQS